MLENWNYTGRQVKRCEQGRSGMKRIFFRILFLDKELSGELTWPLFYPEYKGGYDDTSDTVRF